MLRSRLDGAASRDGIWVKARIESTDGCYMVEYPVWGHKAGAMTSSRVYSQNIRAAY
jgi:hypothetical protein